VTHDGDGNGGSRWKGIIERSSPLVPILLILVLVGIMVLIYVIAV